MSRGTGDIQGKCKYPTKPQRRGTKRLDKHRMFKSSTSDCLQSATHGPRPARTDPSGVYIILRSCDHHVHVRVCKKLCLSLQPFHTEKSRSNPWSAGRVTGGKLNTRNCDSDTLADFSPPGLNVCITTHLPGFCYPPIQCPPGMSNDVGFLPGAHGWQSSNCEKMETTVPSARGKWKHRKHAPEAKETGRF